MNGSGETDDGFSWHHEHKTSPGNAQSTVKLDGEADILVVRMPALQNWVHCSLLQSGWTAPVLAHYLSSSTYLRSQSCSWFKIILLDLLLINWPGSTHSQPLSHISLAGDVNIWLWKVSSETLNCHLYISIFTPLRFFSWSNAECLSNSFLGGKMEIQDMLCKTGFIAVWVTKEKKKGSVNSIASTLIIERFWIFISYATTEKRDSCHKRRRAFSTKITSSILIFRCHLSIQSAKHWGCDIWNALQYAKHPYGAASMTKGPDESCAFLKRHWSSDRIPESKCLG